MKIRISVLFLWMICRCFGFHCCCDLHELKYDLEAKNLSLIIRNKEALLTWTCDIPAENFSNFSYFIYLKHEDWNFETEAACGEEVALTLPDHPSNPVCVRVNAVWNDDICQIESEICVDPGGTRTEESVECIVYNVSSMNCTWTFGKNIPYKTEYTLSLKQDVTVIDCPQYMNDPETRTGSCSFHDLTLDYFNDVTILLNGKGSESHRGIKEKFEPANKEIFNPPTNLTVMNSEDSLLLSWKRPGTQYPIPESCFQYQVERNKELFSDVHNPYSMSNFEKKCLIRIRARGDSTCGMNTNWGQWSDEISCGLLPSEQIECLRLPTCTVYTLVGEFGSDFGRIKRDCEYAPQKDNTELVILLVLLGLSAVIILFTIVINIQYKRIIKFFFPRIPQPKNYFGDVQV